ncbi:MAG: hypothetical protein AB7G37_16725 [Solirubrobacteraceae bacterium]
MSLLLIVPTPLRHRLHNVGAGVDAIATADGDVWWTVAHDAVRDGVDMVWIATGIPDAGALERLTAPLPAGRAAALRTGSVIRPDGSLDRGALPTWNTEREATIDLAAVGGAPITSASAHHLLIEADVLRHLDPPRADRFGPLADREWTARAAAYGGAVHRPASVVRWPTVHPSLPPAVAARHALALRRSGVWGAREAAHRALLLSGRR